MNTAVLEVERKYETNPDTPSATIAAVAALADLPDVAGAPATDRFRLCAVYYDTPTLALAAAHITLRRREGGDDAGWHLKLPAGRDTRVELRLPLTPAERGVPTEFTELLRAATRHARLAPVATIENDRTRHRLHDTTGRLLAEVTLDRVTATNHPARHTHDWTEVEVELGAGPPGLLDLIETRLVGAGLRPATAASKLARALNLPADRPTATAPGLVHAYLGARLADLIRYDIALRRDQPQAASLALPVTRRIRAALRVFAPVLDTTAIAPLTGALRRLERGLRTGGATLTATLDGADYLNLLDALADIAAAPTQGPPARALPPLVHTELRRVRHHLRARNPARARRAARRARYALEVIAPLRPRRTARVAAAITTFTSTGPHTDKAWRAVEHAARPLWRRG